MKEYSEKVKAAVKVVGEGWVESPYYDNVEKQIPRFWNAGSVFKKLFDNLDLTHGTPPIKKT